MTTNTPNKQVAIVTGAFSGIGLGITRALMQHGYHMVANSRNISKSKDLKPSPVTYRSLTLSKFNKFLIVQQPSYRNRILARS
jgi:NADP-dependent 3-hydroxy acid dehydrogenase YdfG